MKPDRCGFGRDPATFDPVTRKALEDFAAFLAGELAMAADGVTYVALDDPAAVHFAPPFEPMEES